MDTLEAEMTELKTALATARLQAESIADVAGLDGDGDVAGVLASLVDAIEETEAVLIDYDGSEWEV